MELVKSHLGRLRIIAFLEGISFLLLMFIAMPLKYYWGLTHATMDIGMAHGILFILYIFMVIPVQSELKWSPSTTLWALVASVLPFGTFIADVKIFRKYAEVEVN
jgi:integral membrane protein